MGKLTPPPVVRSNETIIPKWMMDKIRLSKPKKSVCSELNTKERRTNQ